MLYLHFERNRLSLFSTQKRSSCLRALIRDSGSPLSFKNFDEIKRYLGGSDSVDATGGMQNKVERMIELTRQGISSEIINGTKEGYIKSALLGRTDLGTKIY